MEAVKSILRAACLILILCMALHVFAEQNNQVDKVIKGSLEIRPYSPYICRSPSQ